MKLGYFSIYQVSTGAATGSVLQKIHAFNSYGNDRSGVIGSLGDHDVKVIPNRKQTVEIVIENEQNGVRIKNIIRKGR